MLPGCRKPMAEDASFMRWLDGNGARALGRMKRGYSRSPRHGVAVNHPEPGSVVLTPRNFRGDVSIPAARRRESQVATNESWPLLAELEMSLLWAKTGDRELGEELTNSVLSAQESAIPNIHHRIWLEQRCHSLNIAGILSLNQ
jgi:hypothetical protein